MLSRNRKTSASITARGQSMRPNKIRRFPNPPTRRDPRNRLPPQRPGFVQTAPSDRTARLSPKGAKRKTAKRIMNNTNSRQFIKKQNVLRLEGTDFHKKVLKALTKYSLGIQLGDVNEQMVPNFQSELNGVAKTVGLKGMQSKQFLEHMPGIIYFSKRKLICLDSTYTLPERRRPTTTRRSTPKRQDQRSSPLGTAISLPTMACQPSSKEPPQQSVREDGTKTKRKRRQLLDADDDTRPEGTPQLQMKKKKRQTQEVPTNKTCQGEQSTYGSLFSRQETALKAHASAPCSTKQNASDLNSSRVHKDVIKVLSAHPEGMTCQSLMEAVRGFLSALSDTEQNPDYSVLWQLQGIYRRDNRFFVDSNYGEFAVTESEEEVSTDELTGYEKDSSLKEEEEVHPESANADVQERTTQTITISENEAKQSQEELMAATKDCLVLLRRELGSLDESAWPDNEEDLQDFLAENYTSASATIRLLEWVSERMEEGISIATVESGILWALQKLECVKRRKGGGALVWNHANVDEAVYSHDIFE